MMKLVHNTIISPVYKLVDVYELDMIFDSDIDQDNFTLRIELFRSMANKNHFRYRAWRTELFRIQATFPQNAMGNLIHSPSDETIFVAFSQYGFDSTSKFYADDPEIALKKVIENLGKALEHITSKKLRTE